MLRSAIAFVFVAGSVALGCTTGQSPAPVLSHAEGLRGCALGVSGATVTAEDTPDGIALNFTSKDGAGELRLRANDAAAQHGPGARVGGGHEGRHGHGGDHGLQMMQAPAATTIAEDIEGGARIRFVPADPADKDRLRAKLRERSEAMNAQSCK